jgi:hypothetical protein
MNKKKQKCAISEIKSKSQKFPLRIFNPSSRRLRLGAEVEVKQKRAECEKMNNNYTY